MKMLTKTRHNKKRNTAFIYEALVRELTKCIVVKDNMFANNQTRTSLHEMTHGITNEFLKTNPKAFDKKVPKAHSIIFNENNYAAFHDSNMNWSESRAWKDLSGVENYPDLERIYPNDFSNEFKQSFSFNASYLKLISQTVSTYCQKNYYNDPVMTFNGNHSNTAFLITAKVVLKEFEHSVVLAPKLEFLLMPIQIRE